MNGEESLEPDILFLALLITQGALVKAPRPPCPYPPDRAAGLD